MKRPVLSVAILFIFNILTLNIAAAEQHFEKIEWTWTDRPDAIDPNLPNVLLVGDSLTRNYYPYVAQGLAKRANVFLFATSTSAGDDRLAAQIADYARMIDRRFSVVHFNNGMHGWGYSESEYAAGLPGLVAALRVAAPSARMIWASTTPVRTDIAGGAINARIDARNLAAAHIMSAAAIPTDDQHSLMTGRSALYDDDVHFGAAGAALQGALVTASIAPLLP